MLETCYIGLTVVDLNSFLVLQSAACEILTPLCKLQRVANIKLSKWSRRCCGDLEVGLNLHIITYHCEHGGVDLMGLKPNPLDLCSFSALTLLVGHLTRKNPSRYDL